jgi:hypothetical protein
VSDRKLRLFTVACCRRRRVEVEIPDQRSWDAVHMAEWCADANGTAQELEAARRDAEASAAAGCPAAVDATTTDAWEGAAGLVRLIRERGGQWWQEDDYWEEVYAQADLLREVLGPSPFRPVAVEPGWLTPPVVALARGAYEERAFDRLPFLAGALEETGCTSPEVLNHYRQAGVQARGCWVLDLVLGRA